MGTKRFQRSVEFKYFQYYTTKKLIVCLPRSRGRHTLYSFCQAFTKHLAGETGATGITVNAISPGAINTGLNPWFETNEGKATLLKDQARWISGAILDVDGGFKLTAS